MQSSKQGIWKEYHLSVEGMRKGYLFREKWYVKIVSGWISGRINICSVENCWKKGFTVFRNFYFTNSHEVQTVHLHLLELRLLKIRKKNHMNKKTLLRFWQTCELLRLKDAFIIAFFAAVNHNYDHKKRTLKHRNTQNGSKSTNHKSQTMTFWTR